MKPHANFREQLLAASLKPVKRGERGKLDPDFREQLLAASLKYARSVFEKPGAGAGCRAGGVAAVG